MDTFTRSSEADKADIEVVRLQLKLTVHEVAVALVSRTGSLKTFEHIAEDMRREAAVLSAMATGKTPRR